MDSKKYYWIKLEDGFFNKQNFKILETIPDSQKYHVFVSRLKERLQKLEDTMLQKNLIPHNFEMLALVTGISAKDISPIVDDLKTLGLITLIDNHDLYYEQLKEFEL